MTEKKQWGGLGYGSNVMPYEYWVLENHASFGEIAYYPEGVSPDSGVEEVIKSLNAINERKYWRKLLRESREPKVYLECLKYVDDRYCAYSIVRDFAHDTNLMRKDSKVVYLINNIKIRRYLNNALIALDKMHYWSSVEDVAYFDLKILINKRLDTMDNSLDFILD